jgi:hypothetical protein
MGIHIDIRIDLTRTQKKIIRAAVVAGSAIAALGIGIAIAAPHQWKASDPLAAADLNGLNVVTYTAPDGGAVSYSVGATKFCGTSPTNTNGAIQYAGFTGFLGAKKTCEAVASCGNSPTAHMCTAEEMVRSSQLGMTTATGWVSTGVAAGISTSVISDCLGWTNSSTSLGATWLMSGVGPMSNALSCSESHPILCCD